MVERGAERLHAFYKEQARLCEPGDPKLDWYKRLSALWAANRDRLRPAKGRGDGLKKAAEARDETAVEPEGNSAPDVVAELAPVQ